MGIPAFFPFLIMKYPKILKNKKQKTKKENPQNETEMIELMKKYVDIVVNECVKKDGPPPRTKMMEQRERRFCASIEMQEENEKWDKNVITPGSKFMEKVMKGLCQYITNSLQLKHNVIFSSSNVPGEGEHKILDFIRNLQLKRGAASQAKYNPTH
ncbi:5'-3' exoribonuclease, partial [Reticulomyxa filosa]